MCPPGSKPTILTKGMCSGHYWADLQGRKQKGKQADNRNLYVPDFQPNEFKGFAGFIPTIMGRAPSEEVESGGRETNDDPTPNRNSEPVIDQAYLNLINARKASEKQKYNPHSEASDFQALGDWYNYHVLHCDWICENCKSPIIAVSWEEKISCQSHILPKEHFPSVALNKLNHMLLAGFLSDCGCHYKYDFSWEKAEKMPVFELAISRFLSFKKYLSAKEVLRLPAPFVKYL
jgi:hypothetical protein